jgi:hypothetical protein
LDGWGDAGRKARSRRQLLVGGANHAWDLAVVASDAANEQINTSLTVGSEKEHAVGFPLTFGGEILSNAVAGRNRERQRAIAVAWVGGAKVAEIGFVENRRLR